PGGTRRRAAARRGAGARVHGCRAARAAGGPGAHCRARSVRRRRVQRVGDADLRRVSGPVGSGDGVMPQQPARETRFADLIGQIACWRNLGRKSLAAVTAAFVRLPRDRDWIYFPLYHFIVDDERRGFDRHLRYMRRHGDFITMDDAVGALTNPRGIGGRYFCVTFDDGVKNCVTNAVPILVEHRAPAAFFIATDYVGLRLETDWERIRPFPQPYTGFRAAFDFVTWDDCRRMHSAGMTIGAHTCGHKRLSSLTTAGGGAGMGRAQTRIAQERDTGEHDHAAPD